jgi:hypothetical protein
VYKYEADRPFSPSPPAPPEEPSGIGGHSGRSPATPSLGDPERLFGIVRSRGTPEPTLPSSFRAVTKSAEAEGRVFSESYGTMRTPKDEL